MISHLLSRASPPKIRLNVKIATAAGPGVGAGLGLPHRHSLAQIYRRRTMPGFPYSDLVILALIAGVLLFRLYSVLGRRTGNESSPEEQIFSRVPRPKSATPDVPVNDNVGATPDVKRAPVEGNSAEALSGTVGRAILDIKLADRHFDSERFLTGARAAYEMVVTAFAKGDYETLEGLLSHDVLATFESAITAREERKERVEFTFLGIKSARITGAELRGRTAEITVTFDAQFILAGFDADGKLIEGDPKQPHNVSEIWTFAREPQSPNPNWTLVATAGGD